MTYANILIASTQQIIDRTFIGLLQQLILMQEGKGIAVNTHIKLKRMVH